MPATKGCSPPAPDGGQSSHTGAVAVGPAAAGRPPPPLVPARAAEPPLAIPTAPPVSPEPVDPSAEDEAAAPIDPRREDVTAAPVGEIALVAELAAAVLPPNAAGDAYPVLETAAACATAGFGLAPNASRMMAMAARSGINPRSRTGIRGADCRRPRRPTAPPPHKLRPAHIPTRRRGARGSRRTAVAIRDRRSDRLRQRSDTIRPIGASR